MERTLVLLKPDTVQRGIVGEIITRFEKAGLKMVAIKMLAPTEEQLHEHYEGIGEVISRRGQKVYKKNLKFMLKGPVVAMVLEGIEAVGQVRKLVGTTDPKSSPPGTIRGDYAHMSFEHADEKNIGIPNIVHASGDSDEAKLEVALWFSMDEIYDYKALHEPFTIASDG